MNATQIATVITNVFGDDAQALTRLKLQGELLQIDSKIANVKAEADKNAISYVDVLGELARARQDKQAEIDKLEA